MKKLVALFLAVMLVLSMTAFAEAKPGDGLTIGIVYKQSGNAYFQAGVEGFKKALEEYPNIEVVVDDTANWNTDEALVLVETNLAVYPDVKGIWCANDNMATGALQALDAAGLVGKVGVAGFDANTDIVQAIADGKATCTISSNGYLQGGYTLAICYAVWTGLLDVAQLPENYRLFATPSKLINAETVEEYMAGAPAYDFSQPFFCKDDD